MKNFDKKILKQAKAGTSEFTSTTTRAFLNALKKQNVPLIKYQKQREKFIAEGLSGKELKDATRETKELIPCVAFSGMPVQGGARKNVDYDPQSSTGIFLIDIDDLAGNADVKRVRKIVEDIASCLFAFNSPSGNGVKAGFNVGEVKNDDEFKAWFYKFEYYFKTEHGITIDKSCKDIFRLCFLSYDPSCYVNEDAEIAELDDVPENSCFADIDAIGGKGKWSREEWSLERIEPYVNPISSDDRDDWTTVGMALKETYGDDGFNLWNEWSKKSSKYTRFEADKAWESFVNGKDRAKNIGSIIAIYNRLPKSAQTATAKAATNIKHALNDNELSELDKDVVQYIFVEQGNKVFDTETTPNYGSCTLQEFYSKMANKRVFDPAQPKKKPASRAVLWLENPKRQDAYGERYYPGKKPVFEHEKVRWVNTFYLPLRPVDKKTDKLDVFYNHMKYLFPIEVELKWFIDWMAYNLQYPGKRCKVTPLHINETKRTGRGWIVECLWALLGKHNVKHTKLKTLCGEGAAGGFQAFFNKSILCTIAETKAKGEKFSVDDRIRDLLTEDRLEVNIKHGELQTIDVFTNFFFMSNHNDALDLDKGDGRINVFKVDVAAKSKDYYKTLYNWLETEGVNQLFYMLMNRDLTDFNFQTSMKNKAREELINGTMSDVELAYNEFVDDIILNIEEKNPEKLPPAMKRSDFINEVMTRAEDSKSASRIGYLIRNDSRIVSKVFNDHVNKPQRLLSFDKAISGKDAIISADSFCDLCDKTRFS